MPPKKMPATKQAIKEVSSNNGGLRPVPILYKVAEKMVNEETLNQMLLRGELARGIIESYASGAGAMRSATLPTAQNVDIDKDFEQYDIGLKKIIQIINKQDNPISQQIEQVRTILNKSALLKCHIVEMCMPTKYYVPGLNDLNIRSFPAEKIQEIINAFIKAGALYEHLFVNPKLTIEDLITYISYLGNWILNAKVSNLPFLAAFVSGDQRASATLLKIKLSIQRGADPNLTHETHGTVLHIALANESVELALSLINLFEELKCNFDYSIRDGEGKTVLMLATLLNQKPVIERLAVLHTQKKDIGVNIQDTIGRTPLMIAAVLWRPKIIKILYDLGADLEICDSNGTNIDGYLNANATTISAILKSIFVEAERSVSAPHNWIYFNDPMSLPMAYDESDEPEKRILISKKAKHWALIEKVLNIARTQKDNPSLYMHIFHQVKSLAEESVLENCLKGQKLAKFMIETYRKEKITKKMNVASTSQGIISKDKEKEMPLCPGSFFAYPDYIYLSRVNKKYAKTYSEYRQEHLATCTSELHAFEKDAATFLNACREDDFLKQHCNPPTLDVFKSETTMLHYLKSEVKRLSDLKKEVEISKTDKEKRLVKNI